MRHILAFMLFSFAEIFALSLSDAEIKKLADDPYWSKLLHYQDGKSIIDTKEFFLSPKGTFSLETELKATLKAFNSNPQTVCRFPARYKWLHSKKFIYKIDVECKDLERFLAPKFSKINIVYSTERYSSAASLFGHVLLRVDADETSKVIEYTAKVPKDTSTLSYAYNGITGGFVSRYNFFSFFAKDYQAREQEFRDLIVYDLDFTQGEIENILLHLYEVKSTTQKYFFLSRNCSSELVKLLDIADYSSKHKHTSDLFVLPVEVITSAQNEKRVKSIKLIHSKLKEFNFLHETLNGDEKKIFKEIIDEKRGVNSLIKDKTLKKGSKNKIVLTALLYYEINSQMDKTSQNTLSKILTLSKYKIKSSLTDAQGYKKIKKNPISPYMYKGSFGYLHRQKSYATLGFRTLYKSRFDLLDGVVKNGSVELLDFKVRINEKLSLEHFTLVNLSSMPISSEFFSQPTKELKIGLKRVFYDDELYRYAEYGMGKRMKLNDTISYGFSAFAGVYDQSKTSFGLGLKTELEHKVVSKYFLRLGGIFTRYDDFDNHINSTKIFTQMGVKNTKNSSFGLKLEYSDDINDYHTSSICYNHSF